MLPLMSIHFWHNYLPKFLFLISEFISDEADRGGKKSLIQNSQSLKFSKYEALRFFLVVLFI